MSNKEVAKKIIDSLPDHKVEKILFFLRGIQFDDNIEDDLFCENLLQDYLNDSTPDKHEVISIEDFSRQEGISL